MPIFYYFRDILSLLVKNLLCFAQSRLKPSQGVFSWDLWYESWYQKTRVPELPIGENGMVLPLLSRRSRQRERLNAMGPPVHLFVCPLVSVAKMQKRDFLKN